MSARKRSFGTRGRATALASHPPAGEIVALLELMGRRDVEDAALAALALGGWGAAMALIADRLRLDLEEALAAPEWDSREVLRAYGKARKGNP